MTDKKVFSSEDMAGPHADRENITFKIPVPSKTAPVYFGDETYQDEHRNGWNEEEYELALKQAEQDFNPASVGDSRVQDWKNGVPERNRQGYEDELDDISASSPTSDRTYSDPKRVRGTKQ
ncbi:MAG: hypothetical protein HXX08_24805 [Chloroflexi bacterium]|uniref:Uncharacterized protein n=1 Tax=Candidatus Chlorohelix allophototropha TaxID=3003348 RepID=A0A8T7MAM3_9CHLR|nr:hypothetical protein [Chloroflexota bacterium]WJW69019.1 hypothetical protein OZ401_002610 [Chloroflexota bacterium L227-S17]